jgi:hypothetical protein
MPPWYEEQNHISSFWPSLFDPKKQVVLYQPACAPGVSTCPTGSNRRAKNPLTGELLPSTYIGKIVPGTGDLSNGMAKAGENGVPKGIMDSQGIQYAPRVGVAWQPWGASSKSVIRFGGGAFYERMQGNVVFFNANNPPMVRNSQVLYGNLSTYATGGIVNSPVSAYGFSKDGHLPTTYNYNLSFQRQLPGKLILDVGYVGSISRHLAMLVPFNYAPFGSAWLPQNQDPTLSPSSTGGSALPVDMYRPYVGLVGTPAGFGSGGYRYNFGGSTNFNSLQIGLQRRMTRNLQFGVNYVWGKALGTASDLVSDAMHPTNVRAANYGPLSFDRRQSLVVDYMYNVPDLSRKVAALNNAGWRQLFGGWQLSGITSFSTGGPGMITYVLSNAQGATLNKLITGSEDVAPRPVFTCNPKAISASLTQYVNESCIAAAPKGSIGIDSGKNNVYGPGINNWDISLFKKFQFWKDRPERYIQLRWEMYNAFNHTQWSNFNRAATIDATTGKVSNTSGSVAGGRWGFGALNTNRNARSMQLAAKVYF